MKEPIILMCAPMLNRADANRYPYGTVTDRCGQCGIEVWLAPTGQAMKKEGASLICVPCGLPMAKRVGARVTKEILEEIEGAIPGGAAQVIEILRQFNSRHN